MQKLIVSGRVVRDAVVKENGTRKAINFVIAYNSSYTNKEGVKVEKEPVFYSCTIWRNENQSTAIAGLLTKGIKVLIDGTPSCAIYTTKENVNKIDNKIDVKEVEVFTFVDKKDDTDDKTGTKEGVSTTATEGDDLPF